MSSPPPAEPSPPAHRVTLVAFGGMQLLDLAGPLEVLAAANQAGATPPYELVVSTPGGGAVRTSSGLEVHGQVALPALAALQRWLPDHLGDDLSVERLAERVAMSPRTFARAFKSETGTTPAAHVEALRVEAARRFLETSDLTVAAVAQRVGLARAETLHRTFLRRTGTTPAAYRAHFSQRRV